MKKSYHSRAEPIIAVKMTRLSGDPCAVALGPAAASLERMNAGISVPSRKRGLYGSGARLLEEPHLESALVLVDRTLTVGGWERQADRNLGHARLDRRVTRDHELVVGIEIGESEER